MKSRLYAPGPVELPPEVLSALARPVLHHRTPAFRELQERLARQLSEVFMVPGQEVVSLSSSGSGGLEAALLASVPAGSTVVAINAGKFGERWVQIAGSHGFEVLELSFEWGRAADPAALADLLKRNPSVSAVLATHSETSTGVLHDVRELAAVTRQVSPQALFLVDAVTSLASAELLPLDWGLDAVVSGSQKGLLTPPGLAFVWLSQRAWDNPGPRRGSYYLDLHRYRGGRTPMTPATSLLVALNVALDLLLREGLPNVWARRQRLTDQLVQGALALGFSVFAERITPAVAALRVPEGRSARQIVKALQDQGITIAGGQDHVADELIRPSLLGHADDLDVDLLLAALRRALAAG